MADGLATVRVDELACVALRLVARGGRLDVCRPRGASNGIRPST
ncbi:MAG: hypothetical protein JWM74_523 [Myxococcaceae bacterium]|nr:hypothetical protein [Myxococcaceae bacterium]